LITTGFGFLLPTGRLDKVMIDNEQSEYTPGAVLKCEVGGTPSGQIEFKWTDPDGKVSRGAEFTVPDTWTDRSNLSLTCTALQNLGGVTFNASKSINFTVGEYFPCDYIF
jgi:hypothetical protein